MIYHLALPEAWDAAQPLGRYERSTREQSLADVGYIHASEAGQLARTVAAFYADLDSVLLLSIEEAGLDVRREPADGQLFPHIYGPLPLGNVRSAVPFSPAAGESPPL